ncbi:MAG: hypothetical protein ACP5JN_01485 [Candidatus Micrarchaeia archaeon]|jgi:ribosomal protein L31E
MAMLNISLKKRLAKTHKPRRRSIAIKYIRERVAKLVGVEPDNVLIDPELNRRAQLAARRMESVKVEAIREGEVARAKLFKESKEKAAPESKAQKEAKPKAAEGKK